MADFNDFTLFDTFKKGNKVYLNLSINNKVVSELEVCVTMNSVPLVFNSKIVKNVVEPTLIFIYDFDNTIKPINNKFMIEISYMDIKHVFDCQDIKIKEKKKLALTTLFKSDYKLFPRFYNYYKNEGVEHFFMYYNGIITSEIKKIFNKEDVTLIEWNFRFWNNKQCKYVHHAQLGQMHNALYKYGKDSYEYMIFCDLDEYLHIDNISLLLFVIHNNLDIYSFRNIWSSCIGDDCIDTFPEEFLVSVEKEENIDRSKIIYKTDKVKVIGIHFTSREGWIGDVQCLIGFDMYHFYNWSNSTTAKERILLPQFMNINKKIKLKNRQFKYSNM